MPGIAVVGTQWGDEGKGKISNLLSNKADLVVRYQGGNNAGHSIQFDGKRFALHLLPSAIFNPDVKNVLANGVVVDPMGLMTEIKSIREQGITEFQLFISDRAHIVMPYHVILDGMQEEFRQARIIGTTKRGIGPAYTDKAERIGIRTIDLFDDALLKSLIHDNVYIKNKMLDIYEAEGVNVVDAYESALVKVKGKDAEAYDKLKSVLVNNRISEDRIFELAIEYRDFLKPYVTDTSVMIFDALQNNENVLFEGAQGVLLCLDHGTYPFVTSSSPTSSSAPLNAGIPASSIEKTVGIVKAYSTRVGAGAFPTKFDDEISTQIREVGREFGTTTGRPRLVGWFDAVLVRHAARTSGLTDLSIMLLDVLSNIETIKICNSYTVNGKEVFNVPAGETDFNSATPNYIELPGWTEDITGIEKFDDLPENAKAYVRKIEELTKVKASIVSVGPDRAQTIILNEIW